MLAWMAEVWMVSPLSAALCKSAKQQSLRGLEHLLPPKMLWFDSGIYFANEGPESTQKSESPFWAECEAVEMLLVH